MNYIFTLLLFAISSLAPELAFAGNIFEPSANDISVKILAQIFGGLIDGGGIDAFGGGMTVFNSAILSLGGILAAYTILAGTLGTAHDGEMLGKKFSSMWLPIRFAIGTAIILPVVPGGYCIMQQIVMWLAMQGIGLADKVWESYNNKPPAAANVRISNATRTQAIKVAEDAFIASVCVAAHAQHIKESPSLLQKAMTFNYTRQLDGNTYNYGDQAGLTSYFNNNMCGWVKFPDTVSGASSAAGVASNGSGKLGSFDNLFKAQDLSSINAEHRKQTVLLLGKMDALGQDTVANHQNVASDAKTRYAKILAAADAYTAGINAAAQAMAKGKDASPVSDYGWFLAGAYFTNFIVANDRLTSAINALPTSQSNLSVTETDDDTDKYMKASDVISAAGAEHTTRISPVNGAKPTDKDTESSFSIGGKVSSALGSTVTGIDIEGLKNDPRPAMLIINELGNRLIAIWATGGITLAALSIGAAVPGVGGGVIAFLSTIMGFLFLPITALAATGFVCAYLIPNLPFILFLGAAGGFLIEVIVAICAAPLWAVMHLHPEGHDVAGKGGNGYSMVIELVLRPVMLIFGFIAALTMSDLMGEFLNKIFFQAFSLNAGMGTGMFSFFMTAAAYVIYCVIAFKVQYKCFSLIHIVPDTLFKWSGGGMGSTGTHANEMGKGAEAAFIGAAAVAGRSGNLQFQKFGDDKKIPDNKPPGEKGIDDMRDKLPEDLPPAGGGNGGGGSGGGNSGGAGGGDPGDMRGVGFHQMSSRQAYDSKINALGGKESPLAQSYAKNLAAERQVNPNASSKDSMDSAMKATLNQAYGPGAGAAIKNLAGGQFSGPKFKEGMAMYAGAKNDLSSSGMDSREVSGKLKEATVAARNAYRADKDSTANGGEKDIGNYLKAEFGKFKEGDIEPVAPKLPEPVAPALAEPVALAAPVNESVATPAPVPGNAAEPFPVLFKDIPEEGGSAQLELPMADVKGSTENSIPKTGEDEPPKIEDAPN